MSDSSSLAVPRLGLGAANLGNLHRAMTEEQAEAILSTAWDAGIRYYDTAPHYGLGLSEKRVGAFLRTKPRNEFVISTKVGRLIRPNPDGARTLDTDNDFAVPADQKRVWDMSEAGIRASLDESLGRLGLDSVDILYLHDPERYDLDDGLNHALPALAKLRDEKLVSAIGVGSMTTDALLASVRTGTVDLLMIAGRYTLIDQPALVDVVPECARRGIGIVNASVFNSGLLATDSPGTDARYEYGAVPPTVLDRAKKIGAVCSAFNVSLPAAALQYSLRDTTVRSLVISGSSPGQITQNTDRITQSIPSEFWERLAELGLIPW